MLKKIEGIILKEIPFGDNSKIINVFNKEYGIVGIMAKGVKSYKNPLRVKTFIGTYGSFFIDYNENKLSKLRDVDLIKSYCFNNDNINLIAYITYIIELTYLVFNQSGNVEIYDLLMSTIDKMIEGLNPIVLTNILELKYLKYLGIDLFLDACVLCGNKKDIVTIDPSEGGFVCLNCYKDCKVISSSAIKLIRKYYNININSINKIDISENVIKEIWDFFNDYYDRYSGLYIKSKSFLRKLVNN